MGHTKKRHNLLKRVKGFGGGRKKLIKAAKMADTRAGVHAYRDRRVKKRTMRQLWHIRINAGVRAFGLSYSVFAGKLKAKSVGLNRKVLSELADTEPTIFEKVVEFVR